MNEIKIIAVGGAGASIVKNALDCNMKAPIIVIDKDDSLLNILGIKDADFLCFRNDTDKNSLIDDLNCRLKDSKILVIVGGGAGEVTSLCVDKIAEIAKSKTDDVLCFISMPFDFEGIERIERAASVCKMLEEKNIRCYTASLQSILEKDYYKTQREMFQAIGKEFLEVIKKEILK